MITQEQGDELLKKIRKYCSCINPSSSTKGINYKLLDENWQNLIKYIDSLKINEQSSNYSFWLGKED